MHGDLHIKCVVLKNWILVCRTFRMMVLDFCFYWRSVELNCSPFLG